MSHDRADFGILNVQAAIALGTIITTAHAEQKVAFIDDSGDVAYGTARHLVRSPTNVGFLLADEDVRDGFLRVTMQSGFERFEPVGELIDRLGESFFTDVSV